MPDDKAHATAAELQKQRAELDKVIAEAQQLRDRITEHLRRVRRHNRTDRTGQPYAGPERRKTSRDPQA